MPIAWFAGWVAGPLAGLSDSVGFLGAWRLHVRCRVSLWLKLVVCSFVISTIKDWKKNKKTG